MDFCCGVKPDAVAETIYTPGARPLNANVPSAPVEIDFETFAPDMDVVAPGICAPELSVTWPLTAAVCANAENAQKQNKKILRGRESPLTLPVTQYDTNVQLS